MLPQLKQCNEQQNGGLNLRPSGTLKYTRHNVVTNLMHVFIKIKQTAKGNVPNLIL